MDQPGFIECEDGVQTRTLEPRTIDAGDGPKPGFQPGEKG
jgi:hypothetical protein